MKRILPLELHKDIEEHASKLLRCYTLKKGIHTRIEAFLRFRKERNHSKIGEQLNASHTFVRKWSNRGWQQLSQWDVTLSDTQKRKKLTQVFSDASRRGTPKYTPEQQCQVIAIALKPPSEHQREITHWTYPELADEMSLSGLVPGISKSTIGRLLREADVRPHKSRYWLTPNIDNPEAFQERVKHLCGIYKQADVLASEEVKVISVDEKTGIQALERKHPTQPMKAGRVERQEFEYKRHGTLCLTPSFNVATGEIEAHTIQETRNEQDFLAHIEKTVATSPKSQWIFVLDQLNTHKSESLVRWVADFCEIDTPLGEKGKSGILQDMPSRMAFLEEASHRVRFFYTPKHCSWLNQVEIWFSILSRKLLNRGNFSSKDDLRTKLDRFIHYFNEKLAKPFRWTYQGKVLQA